MTGPRGGAPFTVKPGEPVSLPDHLSHGGSTAYHAPWRCRCFRCVAWRRAYDRGRDNGKRRDTWRPRTKGRSPWYVCVDEFSLVYSWHEYESSEPQSRCRRCGAVRATEEFWEQRWKEQGP